MGFVMSGARVVSCCMQVACCGMCGHVERRVLVCMGSSLRRPRYCTSSSRVDDVSSRVTAHTVLCDRVSSVCEMRPGRPPDRLQLRHILPFKSAVGKCVRP